MCSLVSFTAEGPATAVMPSVALAVEKRDDSICEYPDCSDDTVC